LFQDRLTWPKVDLAFVVHQGVKFLMGQYSKDMGITTVLVAKTAVVFAICTITAMGCIPWF
jgi:hypothetical protein